MNKPLLFILAAVFFISCNYFTKKKNPGLTDKMNMIAADKAFSKMCEEKGMKNAFLEYIDSNGVLLRPDHMPIVGADAIDYLIQQNDSGYTLKWEPRNGVVAQSGELGYTYGVYAMTIKQKDSVLYGTYVSIWKKEADGSWKYVLDSGNEGVGDTKDDE